ncbi:PTS transporter subunit EIIC [Amedibacillus dolichus]|uniref:PTS transporter subunit EIIC n=1 Tax=Amedibacillus dolichus TaxID=31971 RepID=A0ABT7UEA6_9FIRM|nr:PTS transporter subunit EIIC [Amedibacillus dolichus]MDM8157955.1 PTS transporter subunit EIIC [Amedibacillus dolichus]
MAKNYDALAKQVLELVGGRENVASAMHCYTRLRINCKDTSIVDLDAIKQLDVLGAQFTGEQLQVIIGNEVKEVYEAFIEQSGLQKEAMIDEKLDDVPAKKKWTIKGMLTGIVDAIVACVIPLIPILIGSGVLQAIVLIIQQFGWLPADSPTLVTINFVANAAFYFLPVFVGFFAAKKFGANVALGAMLGAALIHPTFVSMVTAGDAGSVFGLPIYSASYSSTIVPIILAVWVMSYVEKFISRYSPKAIRTILEPSLTLIIMIPLTFCLLAPLGAMLSDGFASLLTWFYGIFGPLAVAAFAAIVPWVVMVGIHIGTTAISVTTIAQTGIDAFMMPGFFISNFAQGAACLAVGIKAKTTELRSFAYSCAFSNVVPGISEPGMYGITLRYKTPMAGAMIGAAAGGLYFGLTGTGALQFLPPNIFAFVGYMGEGAFAGNLMNAIIGVVIAMVVAFIATMFLYKPEKENA